MGYETKSAKLTTLLNRWKKDYVFQTMASSALSLGVTILFALYNGFLGIHLLSVWHGSICVFYLLLIALRGIVLLAEKKNRKIEEGKRQQYRHRTAICTAIMLLMLNLALILPISLMVTLNKPVNMGLISAITMAAYTTEKFTMAAVHMRKQKHSGHSNVLIAELRTINWIDALVSVLALQNTLIMVKHTESSMEDMRILSAISGAAIYLVILLTTIWFLIDAVKRKRKLS